MLERKFANYRLYMAGITQKQAEMLYFHCGPSKQEKF